MGEKSQIFLTKEFQIIHVAAPHSALPEDTP